MSPLVAPGLSYMFHPGWNVYETQMKHWCNPGAGWVQRGAGWVQAKTAYNMLIISRGARGASTFIFMCVVAKFKTFGKD